MFENKAKFSKLPQFHVAVFNKAGVNSAPAGEPGDPSGRPQGRKRDPTSRPNSLLISTLSFVGGGRGGGFINQYQGLDTEV